jgi:nucleoside-diphosphate-sugar epimerase
MYFMYIRLLLMTYYEQSQISITYNYITLGHGEVGFSLAKNLLKENHKVVILQDTAADMESQPFCEYSSLTGVEVVTLKLKDIEELNKYLNDKKYDAVIDNNSKDVAQATAITTAVKSYGSSSQYIYISSGGMYKGDMPEGGYMEACCSTKDDNECRIIEKYLESQDMPWTSFRPQYIYGDNTNKRINVDWFVDRIVRERTVPMPGKLYGN